MWSLALGTLSTYVTEVTDDVTYVRQSHSVIPQLLLHYVKHSVKIL